MIYLLDTNAVSDRMGGHSRIVSRLAAMAPNDRAVICPIVRGEILHGIERLPAGKRRSAIVENAKKAFDTLPCEPLLEASGDIYARLRSDCESKGVSAHANDLWITAVALHLGATLVTRDNDLSRMASIQVEDWTL